MMNMMNTKERSNIPNKAFDMEYSTQTRKEMEYLKSCGFNPVYTKRSGEYRIPTYKYTKTPELFKAVADYYEQQKNEKMFDTLESALKTASQIDVWAQPL